MLTLSNEDRDVIARLLQPGVGVLQGTKGKRLAQDKGIILVACSDGDQFHDLYCHKVTLQARHREDPRIHPLVLHGLPCRLAYRSPANDPDDMVDEVFLKCIRGALSRKHFETVALCAHVPCMHATDYGLGVLDQLRLMVAGKIRIADYCRPAEPTIACFLHVDYGEERAKENRRKTYFVNREALRRFTDAMLPPISDLNLA